MAGLKSSDYNKHYFGYFKCSNLITNPVNNLLIPFVSMLFGDYMEIINSSDIRQSMDHRENRTLKQLFENKRIILGNNLKDGNIRELLCDGDFELGELGQGSHIVKPRCNIMAIKNKRFGTNKMNQVFGYSVKTSISNDLLLSDKNFPKWVKSLSWLLINNYVKLIPHIDEYLSENIKLENIKTKFLQSILNVPRKYFKSHKINGYDGYDGYDGYNGYNGYSNNGYSNNNSDNELIDERKYGGSW